MAGPPFLVLAYPGQDNAYGVGALWMESEFHNFKTFPFDFCLAKGTEDNFGFLVDVSHVGQTIQSVDA